MAPKIEVSTFTHYYDKDSTKIVLSGTTAFDDNFIIPIIKDEVIPSLLLRSEDLMIKAVDDNEKVWNAEHGIRESLPKLGNLVLDYSQFNGGPQINYPDKSFTVALNGTVFDPNTTVPTKYTPATFNMTDLGGK